MNSFVIHFLHYFIDFIIYIVEVVKKKWTTMRDYFVRSREKKTTDSAAISSKRDESLSFLLQTSILKSPYVINENIFNFMNVLLILFEFSSRFRSISSTSS